MRDGLDGRVRHPSPIEKRKVSSEHRDPLPRFGLFFGLKPLFKQIPKLGIVVAAHLDYLRLLRRGERAISGQRLPE